MKEKETIKESELKYLSLGNWFTIFMYINIPIIGWIYLFTLSKSKNQPLKREFAKAYLMYKLIILFTCILLIIIGSIIILPYINNLLDYMEML